MGLMGMMGRRGLMGMRGLMGLFYYDCLAGIGRPALSRTVGRGGEGGAPRPAKMIKTAGSRGAK